MEEKLKDILERAIKKGKKERNIKRESIFSDVKENIHYIEKLRELNWTIKDIAEYLTANGYPITENTLRKYLYIIKQKEEN